MIRGFWWCVLAYATVCIGYGAWLLWSGVPPLDGKRFPHPLIVFLLANAILVALVAPTRDATPLNGWDGIAGIHPDIARRIRGMVKLVTTTLLGAVVLLGIEHAYMDGLEWTARRKVLVTAAILGVLYPAIVFAIMALVGRAGVVAPRDPAQPPMLYRFRIWLARRFSDPNT